MTWLTGKRIKELQTIMLEDYQEEMSEQEAEAFGENLVKAFGLLADAEAKCSSIPGGLLTVNGKDK